MQVSMHDPWDFLSPFQPFINVPFYTLKGCTII